MALDPRSPFSAHHPLAGKIAAGVKTTSSARARSPNTHQSMQLAEMPMVTMADRAQQMFSMTDTKGTRVYYSNTGVFNTNDELGKPINFIQGLFKTKDRAVMRFLQYFVDGNSIQYLELEEDAHDVGVQEQPKRSDGGSTQRADEPDQPQSEFGLQLTPEADRSGPGRGDEDRAEQPTNRPAISSGSPDGDDSQEPSSPEQPEVDSESPKKTSALDMLRKGGK